MNTLFKETVEIKSSYIKGMISRATVVKVEGFTPSFTEGEFAVKDLTINPTLSYLYSDQIEAIAHELLRIADKLDAMNEREDKNND